MTEKRLELVRGLGAWASAAIVVGQRETVEPSAQVGGCAGKLSYYVSGLYAQGQTAFSSATPGQSLRSRHAT